MRERLLKTHQASYVLAEWDGTNSSGIRPVGDMLVVLVDVAEEMTRGKIIIPGSVAETGSMASTTGLVIAVGEAAFHYTRDRDMEWAGRRPEPGDRIMFQKYAGEIYTGRDGTLYRLMQDKCVAGVGEGELAGTRKATAAA